MNINPSMLLPLLGMLGGGGNGNNNMENTIERMTKIQSGDPNAILEMIGGGDEKTKNMLNLFQTLPAMMNMFNSGKQVQQQSVSPPSGPSPIDTLANNEINAALMKMLK